MVLEIGAPVWEWGEGGDRALSMAFVHHGHLINNSCYYYLLHRQGLDIGSLAAVFSQAMVPCL